MSPPLEPTPAAFANPWLRYLAATRPAFLSVTLFGCLIGLASAWRELRALDAGRAALTLILALLVHAAVNVLNDYYDARSGTDAANTERVFPFTGGSRFIQNGVLSEAAVRRFGLALLIAVLPGGLLLAWHSGPGLITIGAAGIAIGWAYSAPPLQLASRGLGELAVAAGWWLIVIGTDFVQRGRFAALPFVAGLAYALLVANLLYLNQLPDAKADALAGKRTLVVRLGAQRARWGYLLVVCLAHGWLVFAVLSGLLPGAALFALVSLLPAFIAAALLLRQAQSPSRLAPAIRLTILAALLHGVVLAAMLLGAGA
jgi:1,4-dihydroxy-2-naphthoate octaprenyltransferase